LLEHNKRLQEAEQELLKSLMIQPNQPDVIQHWLHVRQKMCCWGTLSDEIPGLSRDSMVLHAGPLSALALFDNVAQQRKINDVWIQRKTVPQVERLSPRSIPPWPNPARLHIVGFLPACDEPADRRTLRAP
jgi:predicted O-linked N-acetylglucosamine transferase (SPINDLY family)